MSATGDLVTVAALYVERDGVYWNLDGVDPWDEERDARLYDGPHPVVAHPPCARWSLLAGLVEHVHGYKRGDDGGTFAAALDAVRRFGGILEHPAYSRAWDAFGLPEPLAPQGWTGGLCGGFSAHVEQGRYGCPVRKRTWLYAYGVELPELCWARPDGWEPAVPDGRWIDGQHRRTTKAAGRQRDRAASRTPVEFRDMLIATARTSALVKRLATLCKPIGAANA